MQEGEEWVMSSQGEFVATPAGRGMDGREVPCQGTEMGWGLRERWRRRRRRERARLPPALCWS